MYQTDVDRGGLQWRTPAGGLPAAKHLILRQVVLPQPSRRDHGSCMLGLGGIPSAARPPGAPWATSRPHRRPNLPCLPPGHRVLVLGEVAGMPPPIPARLNARVSSS